MTRNLQLIFELIKEAEKGILYDKANFKKYENIIFKAYMLIEEEIEFQEEMNKEI